MAMEIKFLVRVEDSPPSEGVHSSASLIGDPVTLGPIGIFTVIFLMQETSNKQQFHHVANGKAPLK